MHPQRTEFDIRPQSELLNVVADWHTDTRNALTELCKEARSGQWKSPAAVAGVVGVGAAFAVGVLLLIGWAIAAGLSWLAGRAGGATTVWDQVIYPAIAAPIDTWFAGHADVFGFNPTVVMWVWLGLGGFLLLAGSLRSRAGVAMFAAWLGWAAATTTVVYTSATAEVALLSAGITATAAVVASLLPISQSPLHMVPVTPRETRAREEISEQTVALTAAREVGDDACVERIQRDMRDRLTELYPEANPNGYWRADWHQRLRESRAVYLVLATAVLAGTVLVIGMIGGHLGLVVVAVLAAITLAGLLVRPSDDEVYARQLQRELQHEQQREAGAAVLREAEATLRAAPLDDDGGTGHRDD